MSAATTHTPARSITRALSDDRPLLRAAHTALAVGALSALAFTAVSLFTTTTPDGHRFHHAADYWYHGLGMIPFMIAPAVLIVALHLLNRGRDGRLARVGTVLTTAALAVYVGMGSHSLIAGKGSSLGPTYMLATIASFIGLGLFVAGCWHTRLLPRWVLVTWLVAWIIGGPLPAGPTPLLLVAAYVTIAITLAKTAAPSVHNN
jgi:hypothetical protein